MGISLLLPILLVLFVLLLKNAGKNLGQRKQKWILAGYGLILVTSLLILLFLPQDSLHGEQGVGDETIDQAREARDTFYSAVMEGRPEDVAGAYVTEKWSFPLADNNLTIAAPQREWFSGLLVVEKTEDLTDRIELTHYVTRTIVNHIDFTDSLQPPGVSLENSRLLLREYHLEISLAQFQREFVVAQLLGEEKENWWLNPGSSSVGAEALYLRVPEDAVIVVEEQRINNYVILGEESIFTN
ncbi:hypothetical protein [Dethiobacter alkaliphilus]|uniref:Uncharacterized protein n=1 Tax=Dethiobacter alkaliphilus AHT 1 TaxID=555088 RepID=C0GL03_DETAL|nr:hypothetical protein [Dethiobacter alkaliphilus]EEG75990.1 hypothetical protein DealDRAFT_3163 [Dethiobacter alkaliphilus AHT 1]